MKKNKRLPPERGFREYSNKPGWERPRCNLCQSYEYSVVWNDATSWLSKGVYQIVKCSKCGLVYLSPRPTEKTISKYYQPESYWGTNIYDLNKKQEKSLRDKAYGMLYRDIFAKVARGSILDIGAGTGLFLTKFKEKGWNVSGVELSKEACNYAGKVNKIKLEKGDFLKLTFPKNHFDVVTLNGCLEHLHKPKETLKKIRKILKKVGLLLITVPNFDSIGRRLFGKAWYALQPPTHLYHFTPKALVTILSDAGFKVDRIKHSYWQHNNYIIFESIRMVFSPKFKKSSDRGIDKKKSVAKKSKPSIKLEVGKVLARVVAIIIAKFGQILKRAEVITVYAKKA